MNAAAGAAALNVVANVINIAQHNQVNQRRSIGLRAFHFQRIRKLQGSKDRARGMSDSYLRKVYRRTHFPGTQGPITRFTETCYARRVYLHFMRFNRIRDPDEIDAICDLYLEYIGAVRHFTNNELDFICGLPTNGNLMYPNPAPVGPGPEP